MESVVVEVESLLVASSTSVLAMKLSRTKLHHQLCGWRLRGVSTLLTLARIR